MAKTRRIIRKTHPTRYLGVDDQLWPLVMACCVLGGFLTGTVLAYFPLDEPQWYANGWTWLIAIPLVIAALLVLLVWTGNRLLRRSMQLALVLGLIIHLVLLIISIETDVFHRVWTEVLASTQRAPQKQVVRLPDYASRQHDPEKRARSDLEQPVETKLPEPQVQSQRPQQTREQPTRVPVETPPIPEPQQVPRPDVVRRKQPNAAVPRQRDQASQLSRREAALRPLPTQQVRIADVQRQSERQPDVATPRTAQPRSREQPIQLDRPSLPNATQLPATAPSVELTRKSEPVEPSRDSTAAASMSRRSTQAGVTPRTDVRVDDQPAVARRNEPNAPAPNNTVARKQRTSSPVTQPQAALPVQQRTTAALTRRQVEQQAAPQQPTLAQTPRRVANRQQRVTQRSDVATVADVPPVALASPGKAEPIAPDRRSRVENPATIPTQAQQAPLPTPPDRTASLTAPARSQRGVTQSEPPATGDVSAKLPGANQQPPHHWARWPSG